MTEPGKIIRLDFRKFAYSGYVNYERTKKQRAGMTLLADRLDSYFEGKDIVYTKTLEDNFFVLEFAKLADARMFVLSFSDVITTNGVRFD